jgi:hypothetical protein
MEFVLWVDHARERVLPHSALSGAAVRPSKTGPFTLAVDPPTPNRLKDMGLAAGLSWDLGPTATAPPRDARRDPTSPDGDRAQVRVLARPARHDRPPADQLARSNYQDDLAELLASADLASATASPPARTGRKDLAEQTRQGHAPRAERGPLLPRTVAAEIQPEDEQFALQTIERQRAPENPLPGRPQDRRRHRVGAHPDRAHPPPHNRARPPPGPRRTLATPGQPQNRPRPDPRRRASPTCCSPGGCRGNPLRMPDVARQTQARPPGLVSRTGARSCRSLGQMRAPAYAPRGSGISVHDLRPRRCSHRLGLCRSGS